MRVVRLLISVSLPLSTYSPPFVEMPLDVCVAPMILIGFFGMIFGGVEFLKNTENLVALGFLISGAILFCIPILLSCCLYVLTALLRRNK